MSEAIDRAAHIEEIWTRRELSEAKKNAVRLEEYEAVKDLWMVRNDRQIKVISRAAPCRRWEKPEWKEANVTPLYAGFWSA